MASLTKGRLTKGRPTMADQVARRPGGAVGIHRARQMAGFGCTACTRSAPPWPIRPVGCAG